MYSNIVDILEYDQFRIRLSKYERKKERKRRNEREREGERDVHLLNYQSFRGLIYRSFMINIYHIF